MQRPARALRREPGALPHVVCGGLAGPGDIPAQQIRLQTDAEFVEAIRNGAAVSPDFEDGVQYMAFSEAVAFSCHTGEMTDVSICEPKMKCWGQTL